MLFDSKMNATHQLASKVTVFFLCAFIFITIVLLHILVLSRIHVNSSKWSPAFNQQRLTLRQPPVRLAACANHRPLFAETDFAVMSLYAGPFHLYGVSAMKLASTVRSFTNADMVMMSVEERPMTRCQRIQLEEAGWKVCSVSAIEGPAVGKTNRFLDGLVYSKFNAWQFTEYRGVLFLDADTLVVGDITPAFLDIIPQMQMQNKTVAAARDRPVKITCRFFTASNHFNSGVLLLIPSTDTYRMLKHSIGTVPHQITYGEQELLNVLYHDLPPTNQELYELPFAYNAIIISKECEQELWRDTEDHMKVVHLTMAKGWTYTRHWSSIPDPFLCWYWGVQDLCRYWDSISTPPETC